VLFRSLIKGGVYLEEARKLKVVALDKTGTLTEGKPRLVAQAALSQSLPEAEVLRIAKSLASRSDHPVSKAVSNGLDGEELAVEDFGADMGRGVHGTIHGRKYILGNHRWVHERGLCSAELEARLEEHEAQGHTLSLLADSERVLGLFAVADTVKETSRQAVADLKTLGIRSIMLTGDNPSTAKAIAGQVGIDDVQANLLPEDKLKVISELGQTQQTGMVGDGVNDSPSLAAASVGFSMGGAGTDTAKEAADVLIMNDDLRKVPETIRLSKRTHAILWQNIVLALGIKAVFFDLGETLCYLHPPTSEILGEFLAERGVAVRPEQTRLAYLTAMTYFSDWAIRVDETERTPEEREALGHLLELTGSLKPFFLQFDRHASQPVAAFARRLHPILAKHPQPRMQVFGKVIGVLIARSQGNGGPAPEHLGAAMAALEAGQQAEAAKSLTAALFTHPELARDPAAWRDENLGNLAREINAKLKQVDLTRFQGQ